jgi:hypothetical protein
MRSPRLLATILLAVVVHLDGLAEPIRVRFAEGTSRGFLSLRTMDGTQIAIGAQVEIRRGSTVTNRLTFRFKDGSLDDDTTVYSVAGVLRMISDHRIQKGPAFPTPIETRIETRTGEVSVTYTDDKGETKHEVEHMDLPPDVSNGMMAVTLRNMDPRTPATVSYVAATPKPMLVTLHITNAGLDPFTAAGAPVKATHYVIKIDPGGVKGLIAPLVGKQPPDQHVWILTGEAPVFVASETNFFMDGPTWRMEPAAIDVPRH